MKSYVEVLISTMRNICSYRACMSREEEMPLTIVPYSVNLDDIACLLLFVTNEIVK